MFRMIKLSFQDMLNTRKNEKVNIIKADRQRTNHLLCRRKIKQHEEILHIANIKEFQIIEETAFERTKSSIYQKVYIPDKIKPKKMQITCSPTEEDDEELVLEIQTEE